MKRQNKFLKISISMLLIFAMAASMMLIPNVHAQNLQVPTISFCNVAPNPCGVGQTVTVDFWLAVPIFDSQDAHGLTVKVTTPAGTTSTLGPFTTDTTGGTWTTYTPATIGNYTFQMFYPGENFSSTAATYKGDYNEPSESNVVTLVVTQTARTGLADTPLPTAYWQTPVNAENVQNWASLTGSWLGYLANTFAATGGYNDTGNYNPYTATPQTAHILWTKPWCVGGVAGGPLGNSEQYSNYWTATQYDPKYAPIIIDGMEYSTWYTTTTSSEQGIICIDLYNGQTNWVINTTTVLRCGMVCDFENINQYGVVGPYIWTTGTLPPSQTGGALIPNSGTQWNMYDGLTGQYLCSIVNGTSPTFLGQDARGDIIGYVINATSGSMLVNGAVDTFNTTANGNTLLLWNMTAALQQTGLNWAISLNHQYLWRNGYEWAVPMAPKINGNLVAGLGTGSYAFSAWAGNTLVVEAGTVSVAETEGFLYAAGYSTVNGALLWIENITSGVVNPSFTRISNTPAAADGVFVQINQDSYQAFGYSLTTGQQVWTTSLNVRMADGNMPNPYDSYDLETVPDSSTGVLYVWGLGGDVWALNMTNGNIIWDWSTYQVNGPAGTESPYGIYPLWVFQDEALAGQGANTVLYLSEGHEYDPPLFHGALEVALDGNNGTVLWTNLGFDDTATAVAYGIMTTFNSYDGQIYAYGQGPSKTTISVPQVGVTTATPMTISGTITDISAGASQAAVAANFPNGLPCVSDASMSGLMEAAYEQQPLPTNLTGVPISVYVLDSNNNYRLIGTTTSNSLGDWGLTWTPDITGNYTVYAIFSGTAGYYPSSASTFFNVGSPSATTAPTASPVSGLATENTLMYIGAALILVVIVIGAVLAILVTRKRP